MTKVQWDKHGSRRFETGLDRGVLYLDSRPGIPWNGLLSVDSKIENLESTPQYFDGVKYMIDRTSGDFAATLKAYTYPDEFLELDGYGEVATGIFADAQPVRKTFGLSYRTRVGNDVEGIGLGYKIHILYNLTAIPSNRSHSTIQSNIDPMDFSWDIRGIPVSVPNFKPTVHFVVDSLKTHPRVLSQIETILYGDHIFDPRLPLPTEIAKLSNETFYFVYHDDGTWSAYGPDSYFDVSGDGTFSISNVDTTYIGPHEYIIPLT